MNTEWVLDVIYKGTDDPAYAADFAKLEEKIEELGVLAANVQELDFKEAVERLLAIKEDMVRIFTNLDVYLELRQSVDAEDGAIMAQTNRLQKLYAKAAPIESAVKKILAGIEDIDAMAKESDIIQAYAFLLKENQKEAKHLLSDQEEAMVSTMNMTGGAAWGQLFSYLTSTVKVDDGSEVTTLSEIRNRAYSPKKHVRKAAYEAELCCYEKIEDAIAFALNNIKGQVLMLCEKRGYSSPLEMTLAQSRMSRETLDAMMEAVEEYLPVFRKYLQKKAKVLGYESGLPWYELFAPVGNADKTYTTEEAKQYLLDIFGTFSPDMADMMKEAFEEGWIDFYPRKGKVDGAFCSGVHSIKQSRILTNFDGYLGSVNTLAHELGHAYHNRQLEGERPMNQEYPMPVAETASTFNEIHLVKAALKTAEGEERLNLLENNLLEQTQCIVDIYSRYLFETAVFEQGKDRFLMAPDLKNLMAEAQKKAYGNGLDERYLHPYMWACKSHYYSPDLSFYNFPYAFGSLFATGLYSRFEKEGAAFVPAYRNMLKATPCCTIEEAGAMVGIDLTSAEFWRESLVQIERLIEEFCRV